MFRHARCIEIQALEADLLSFCSKSQQLQRDIRGLLLRCNHVASCMCRLGYCLITVVNAVFISASCDCECSIVGFAHSRQRGNALGAINAPEGRSLGVSNCMDTARSIDEFFCAANPLRIPAASISFGLRDSGPLVPPNACVLKR
jgi:hypothetical protein